MKGVVTAIEDTTFTLKVNEEDYIVHTSKDTLFAHIKNKRAYTFEDIEVGQNLQIATDGTVMTSLPPQVGALAITFLD
jgi:hypothetical protein